MKSIQVRAYDDQGNEFSSLDGLKFHWQLENGEATPRPAQSSVGGMMFFVKLSFILMLRLKCIVLKKNKMKLMLIYVYSSKNKENWYQNLKNISTKMKKLSNYCLPNSIGTSIPNNLTLILFALAVANRIIGSPSSWSSFSGCLLHNKRLILFNFLSDIERNRYIQSRLINKWFWKRLVFFCVFFSRKQTIRLISNLFSISDLKQRFILCINGSENQINNGLFCRVHERSLSGFTHPKIYIRLNLLTVFFFLHRSFVFFFSSAYSSGAYTFLPSNPSVQY